MLSKGNLHNFYLNCIIIMPLYPVGLHIFTIIKNYYINKKQTFEFLRSLSNFSNLRAAFFALDSTHCISSEGRLAEAFAKEPPAISGRFPPLHPGAPELMASCNLRCSWVYKLTLYVVCT